MSDLSRCLYKEYYDEAYNEHCVTHDQYKWVCENESLRADLEKTRGELEDFRKKAISWFWPQDEDIPTHKQLLDEFEDEMEAVESLGQNQISKLSAQAQEITALTAHNAESMGINTELAADNATLREDFNRELDKIKATYPVFDMGLQEENSALLAVVEALLRSGNHAAACLPYKGCDCGWEKAKAGASNEKADS